MTNPLMHERAVPHRLLTDAQARMLLKRLGLELERFPGIPLNDPVLVAMVAEGDTINVGDIIEIERKSVTSGHSLYWRCVIPPMTD